MKVFMYFSSYESFCQAETEGYVWSMNLTETESTVTYNKLLQEM